MIHNLPHSLIEAAKKILTEGHDKIYYRGTNNKDEEELIQTGKIHKSKNHITGEYEKGLSVSDTKNVGEYFKFLYTLSGKEIGVGSDGEPVLDVGSLKFKNWINESDDHPLIDVDGVMKHRHNSNGVPIHHTDEGIRNFHRWFGDSKTVDEHGRPKVFYHGTSQDFDKFNPKKSFTGIGVSFFSPDKHFADSYDYHHNSGSVMPVYIKSSKPFDLENEEHRNKLHTHMSSKTYYSTFSGKVVPMSNDFPKSRDYFHMENPNVINSIKELKHDSFLVDERGSSNIGVFNPKNIKSAIGNSGEFNKTSKITEETEYQTERHYNINDWKKAARKLGAIPKNMGQMAGTSDKVNIWYAQHPDNDQIGGEFFHGKGWNYGHVSY